jgi:hypothetical protein
MTDYLLTASNMPDCVATAAFAKVVYEMKIILVEHNHKFNTVEDIKAAISANGLSEIKNGYNNLYIIGSFWKNSINVFASVFDQVGMYTFGEKVEIANENIVVFSDVEKKGSISWLKSIMPQKILVDLFMISKQQIISKANVRCFGEGPDDVQQLFTGVYDYSTTTKNSVFDVFIKLFINDNVLYDSIMERGRILLSNHKGLAEERARKNTKIFTAKCGAKVALTEGTELTNFTHEALVKTNSDVDVTVVFSYKLSKEGTNDEMRFSIRSYSEKFNAAEIIEHVKGSGGSKGAAGCYIPAPLNFGAVL